MPVSWDNYHGPIFSDPNKRDDSTPEGRAANVIKSGVSQMPQDIKGAVASAVAARGASILERAQAEFGGETKFSPTGGYRTPYGNMGGGIYGGPMGALMSPSGQFGMNGTTMSASAAPWGGGMPSYGGYYPGGVFNGPLVTGQPTGGMVGGFISSNFHGRIAGALEGLAGDVSQLQEMMSNLDNANPAQLAAFNVKYDMVMTKIKMLNQLADKDDETSNEIIRKI